MVFEPFDLSQDITPQSIRSTLRLQDYSRALIMALKLNEANLIQQVYETIPPESVAIVVRTTASSYIERLMHFIVGQVEASPHIQFHVKWIEAVLYNHSATLQNRSPGSVSVLRAVQKTIGGKFDDLSKLCEHNRYTLEYVKALCQLHASKKQGENGVVDVQMTDDEEDSMESD